MQQRCNIKTSETKYESESFAAARGKAEVTSKRMRERERETETENIVCEYAERNERKRNVQR